ncbi:MAG: PAS domain S-box protein [Burkholderiales bacterium]|nr:PAS domain S-box protein [Burkholderiales bacterium]
MHGVRKWQSELSHEILAAIIDSAPTANVMVDGEGRIVLANAEAERMFRYPREEMMGLGIEQLVPERFRDLHRIHRTGYLVQPLARGMGQGRDLYGLRRDGSEFPIEIGLNPVETQEGPFVLSAIVDITERKEIENRFRLAVEAAPVAILMVDAAGRIALANPESARLFGFSVSELIGQPLDMLVPDAQRGQHPALRQGFIANPASRRMGGGRVLHALRKDNSEVPVAIGLAPLNTPEGQLVLSVIVDISERVAAEEKQRALNEELERRVGERTAELAQAIEALTESNVELQQFAYVASHDLQTPLRGIAGCAQILESQYSDAVDEAGRDIIRRMVQSTVHLQALIRDLLAYSRIENRERPFMPVDLNAVLTESLALLDASIIESHATVTHDPLPTVIGDRTQLVQLFSNVIGNAVKYHGDALPVVHVWATPEEADTWRISIRDNGIGIAAEHLERVFEVFTRLHSHKAYPGTGIGLAVCRRVVGRHNGRIWVDSVPGEGSTFHFTLGVPASTPAQPESEKST